MKGKLSKAIKEFQRLERMRREGHALSVAEIERWNILLVYIQREISGPTSNLPIPARRNRRYSIRLPYRTSVMVNVWEDRFVKQRFVGEVVNISEGGMFVATAQNVPVGTKLHLEVELEDLEFERGIRGEVAWRRGSQHGVLPAGFGVRFCDMDEDKQELLRSFINQLLGKKAFRES